MRCEGCGGLLQTKLANGEPRAHMTVTSSMHTRRQEWVFHDERCLVRWAVSFYDVELRSLVRDRLVELPAVAS